MNRLRPLVVIDSLGQGGAEQSLAAILPELVDHGIDARIVCRYRADSHAEQRLVDAGVPVTTMPDRRPLHAARWLRGHVAETCPSLLHLNLFVPTMLGAWGTIGRGVPIVVSIVSTPEAQRPGVASWKLRVVREAEGFACRRLCSTVHAVTPGVKATVHRDLRVREDKIRVVERGRDPGRFHPPAPQERAAGRRSLDVTDDTELVVAVGRHEYQKGFDVLLEAVADLQARRDRTVVLIAGRPGAQTSELETLIAALPRPHDVRLLGDRDDVAEILRAADVFVMSSRREGAAGAAIEAMATGLPIVASDLAGTAGVLHHERNALLVPSGHAAPLGAAIARLLDDTEFARSLGHHAAEAFTARFSLDRAVEQMADMYRSVAEERPTTVRSILMPSG